MGVLDKSGNQVPGPESANPLIILQLAESGGGAETVTICADTLRSPDSGVTDVGGSVLESNLQAACLE